MKIQHRFNQDADAAANRYGNLIEALRGVYLSAFSESTFGSPRSLDLIAQEANSIVTAHLRYERDIAAASFDRIVWEALSQTQRDLAVPVARMTSEALSELSSATLDYLMNEIRVQSARDVSTLVEAARRAALQISLAMRAHGMSRRSATIDYQFGSSLEFYFRDRRNYRIMSRKFIRSVWRQSLLSLYNETVLLTLADYGEATAQVEHLDAKAPIDGMIVAMSAGAAHPIYDEVRAEVFHPNSDAVLRRARAA
jgi:hypothetical protein